MVNLNVCVDIFFEVLVILSVMVINGEFNDLYLLL